MRARQARNKPIQDTLCPHKLDMYRAVPLLYINYGPREYLKAPMAS